MFCCLPDAAWFQVRLPLNFEVVLCRGQEEATVEAEERRKRSMMEGRAVGYVLLEGLLSPSPMFIDVHHSTELLTTRPIVERLNQPCSYPLSGSFVSAIHMLLTSGVLPAQPYSS